MKEVEIAVMKTDTKEVCLMVQTPSTGFTRGRPKNLNILLSRELARHLAAQIIEAAHD